MELWLLALWVASNRLVHQHGIGCYYRINVLILGFNFDFGIKVVVHCFVSSEIAKSPSMSS
jgi:hypothetical protein